MKKHLLALWVLAAVLQIFAAGARADVQDILTDLESYAVQTMAEQGVPGMAYAIVKDDAVIYAKGFGVRESGKTDAVDVHTVFEIGSTSKAFTSALLAVLVDRGALSWDDPVRKHWPGFAMFDPWVSREFQIADLVSQRSGMPSYSTDPMAFLGFARERVVRSTRYVEPASSFRSRFCYVNNLFVTAGKVIEARTGLSYEDSLDVTFFGPLGMSETTANPEIVATWTNVARGNITMSDGSLWPIPDGWIHSDWIDIMAPAGGIRSTVLDMTRWVRLMLGRGSFNDQQLISRANVAYLQEPRIFAFSQEEDLPACYASGWLNSPMSPHALIWHNGTTFGMHAVVGLVPAANTGIVVLTNTGGNTVPEKLMFKFYELAFNSEVSHSVQSRVIAERPDSLFSTARHAPRSVPEPQAHLPFERYCGVYSNPAYGPVTVKMIGRNLYAIVGPKRIRAPLTPYSGNTFIITLSEELEWVSLATFVVEPDQNASAVVIDLFEDVNKGRFERTAD